MSMERCMPAASTAPAALCSTCGVSCAQSSSSTSTRLSRVWLLCCSCAPPTCSPMCSPIGSMGGRQVGDWHHLPASPALCCLTSHTFASMLINLRYVCVLFPTIADMSLTLSVEHSRKGDIHPQQCACGTRCQRMPLRCNLLFKTVSACPQK